MRNSVIAALIAKHRSAAHCAAALGISRQAFRAALARQHLSERLTRLAAILLDIDVLAAITANNAAKDPALPVLDAAANLPAQLHINADWNTNYALSKEIKKTANAADKSGLHMRTLVSKEQQEALDLIRWVYAVARLPADSPRFNWYVSRWAVPEKIARAKQNGTFPALVANCPPIDPTWIRFVPAALAACDAFKSATTQHRPMTRASSGKPKQSGKTLRLAA